MRFVHSLAKTQDAKRIGWCSPIELGEAAPHYISFALPINGRADQRYLCEAVQLRDESRVVTAHEMTREDDDSFVLNVGDVKLWFTIRPSKDAGPLLYIGRLEHPDFSYFLTEIEPEEPSELDRLCEEKYLIVVGCDPFTPYAGIESLAQRPACSR
jgi:hypothetical protein